MDTEKRIDENYYYYLFMMKTEWAIYLYDLDKRNR